MPNQHKFSLIRPRSSSAEKLTGQYPQSVNTALDRYLAIVAVPPAFEEAEWNLMRDACNGWATQMEPSETLRDGLILQVSDSIELSGLATKWNVDSTVLIEKLTALTLAEAIAVVYAIEQFWDQD